MSEYSKLTARRHFTDEDEATFFKGVRFAPTDRELVAYARFKELFPENDDHPFQSFAMRISEIDPTEVKARCKWPHSNQDAFYFFAVKKREKEKNVWRKPAESIWTNGNSLFGVKHLLTFKGNEVMGWNDWLVEEFHQPYPTPPSTCWIMVRARDLVDFYAKPLLKYTLNVQGVVEGDEQNDLEPLFILEQLLMNSADAADFVMDNDMNSDDIFTAFDIPPETLAWEAGNEGHDEGHNEGDYEGHNGGHNGGHNEGYNEGPYEGHDDFDID